LCWITNLSNGRHSKLEREVTHRTQQLILVLKGLILLVRRPAVSRDKGVHNGCIGERSNIKFYRLVVIRPGAGALGVPRIVEAFGGVKRGRRGAFLWSENIEAIES
jgi:hypothetical protein